MTTILLVVIGVTFIGVQTWCLETRLRYRNFALVSVFILGTLLGFAIGYMIIPYNPAMIFVMSISIGMSNVFGVQIMVARLPQKES